MLTKVKNFFVGLLTKAKNAFLGLCFIVAFKSVHLKLWEAVVTAFVLILTGLAFAHDFWSGVAVFGFGVAFGLFAWWGRHQ